MRSIKNTRGGGGWTLLLSAAVLAVYLYVLMEWLFFVTKPSFVAAMGRGERLGVLLISPLPVAGLFVLMISLLWLGTLVLRRAMPERWGLGAGWSLPAAVLAACAFLLIDNFTYTIFDFGVVSTRGSWRWAYAALLLLLFVASYRSLRSLAFRSPAPRPRKILPIVAASLAVVSMAFIAWRYASATVAQRGHEGQGVSLGELPNILILSTDGLNAASMSAYGYPTDTTPNIRARMGDALVCENALVNANVTVGSTASMLTGKVPTRTRLFWQGQILDGADAYQHLPAILRRLGYRSIALVPGIADPFKINIRDSFDVSNNRQAGGLVSAIELPGRLALAYSSEVFFLEYLSHRIGNRLQHAGGAKKMENPFLEVTERIGPSDRERVDALLRFLDESDSPIFAFLHLIETKTVETPEIKMRLAEGASRQDIRDDSVLSFDAHFGKVVSHLAERGKLSSTVLVVTSDHGFYYSHQRVPLVFFFPNGAHRGRIAENVQLLDVAPTLLDYLGAPVPEWMEGQSLIASQPEPARPIITAKVSTWGKSGGTMDSIALTSCDHVFELVFGSGELVRWRLADHTARCDAAEVPNEEHARELLIRRLQRSNFDLDELHRRPRAKQILKDLSRPHRPENS